MPTQLDVDLGTIGALLGSAAYFTHLLVNGLTLAWPSRPRWFGWLAAMLGGMLLTGMLAVASLPADTEWTRQIVARIMLVGLAAGGAAAGASVTQTSAEASRKQVLAAGDPQPEPLTAQPGSIQGENTPVPLSRRA